MKETLSEKKLSWSRRLGGQLGVEGMTVWDPAGPRVVLASNGEGSGFPCGKDHFDLLLSCVPTMI